MDPAFWDVLSVVVQVLLHYHSGAQYAWAAVFLLVSMCCVNRDLEVHEMFAAVFMLRSACSSLLVSGNGAGVMAAFVIFCSVGAHAGSYLAMPHVFRRPLTCTLAASSVMLRYEWNVSPAVAVLHLALFNLITRYKIVYRAIDSWDAAAQSMYLLALPTSTCVIGFLIMLAEARDVINVPRARHPLQFYQKASIAESLV